MALETLSGGTLERRSKEVEKWVNTNASTRLCRWENRHGQIVVITFHPVCTCRL